MATKVEILSVETIKPSSQTHDHNRNFKISLLDQLAPTLFYVPIVLFYSKSDITTLDFNFTLISKKLKASLSDTLTIHYPFCGRMKGNSFVECNDDGVLYFEAKVASKLSEILKNPTIGVTEELLPFDPYNPKADLKELVNMAVQVSEFSCGGIAVGVCILHKIADGATMGSFLNSWAAKARANSDLVAPFMESALYFPPRDIYLDGNHPGTSMIRDKTTIVTKRFIFDGTNLHALKEKFVGFNPTRVEAVTALIWKSAMEASKASSKEQIISKSMVTHAVNIRSRMVPPLPENSLGNLWQQTASDTVEVDENLGLNNLAMIVRETLRKIDGVYLRKLQGDKAFDEALKFMKKVKLMICEGGVSCYSFSSWTRFGFYEADFGWGKPTWVCTVGVPIENAVILMATKSGDGIEAWITLGERDMVEFERNPELLQFCFLVLLSMVLNYDIAVIILLCLAKLQANIKKIQLLQCKTAKYYSCSVVQNNITHNIPVTDHNLKPCH